MNRQIFLSIASIAVTGALVAGATGAFFSDTETSTGNTFTAGDIDLKIDNTSYVTNDAGVLVASPNNTWALADLTNQLFFSFDDVKPGDIGEDTISVHAGSNDAWACMAAKLTSTPDNGINSPEAKALDVTDGSTGGELQNFLNFVFWNDDGDNVYEIGETQITQLAGPASTIFSGTWLPIADSGNGTPITGETTRYIGKVWCFGTLTPAAIAQDGLTTSGPLVRGTGFTCNGSGNNNIAQTDGIVVDVSFQGVQARNNGQFLCSSLPPLEGTPNGRPTAGALLSAYVAPTTCDATVDDSFESPVAPNFNTIQAAINDAGTTAGETVCVKAGSYVGDVNVNKSIILAGDGPTLVTLTGVGTGESGALVVSADNVTVKGLKVIGTGVSALRISGAHTGNTFSFNHAVAASGQNAFLTDGGQTNHTISDNLFEGTGSQLAYVNGLASVNIASSNVDFLRNTFSGSATLALGQEASSSDITLNRFSTTTSFADIEDWGASNLFHQNNFNDAGLNLQHSENVNTGDTGITNAENNWWGDIDPTDGDVNPNIDVDFTPFEVSAFPQN